MTYIIRRYGAIPLYWGCDCTGRGRWTPNRSYASDYFTQVDAETIRRGMPRAERKLADILPANDGETE